MHKSSYGPCILGNRSLRIVVGYSSIMAMCLHNSVLMIVSKKLKFYTQLMTRSWEREQGVPKNPKTIEITNCQHLNALALS